MVDLSLEQRAVNVIRGISMDGPHAARSGHQGTAMALAPVAHVLFTRIMRYDAADPSWPDRDRFVLSCGHASILQYSMLHLTGFDLSREDLLAFRQLGSRTPGHPEAELPGVEVTTGPLGQGFANGVGLSLAERHLRARFGADLCDHHTFVLCSDGDLEEGISHESASLAGHLGLGRLIAIYDDNGITIDGKTDLALSDDAAQRFRAYGWDVVELGDVGDDFDAIEAGIRTAMANDAAPSLVIVRTHVGTPSPTFTDDPAAHGYVFRDAEISETKALLGIPDEPFHIPDDVLAYYRAHGAAGGEARAAWARRRADRSDEGFEHCLSGGDVAWESVLPRFEAGSSVATRVSSEEVLNSLLEAVPSLIGGGADLTANTGTRFKGHEAQSAANPAGRQIYFGIREHAMGAILNGLALHGGTIPVGGTFLVFSDYLRGALRMAALSEAHAIFVFTHDSIGVGEDGPTHQPVEQVASLRAIPGLRVIRPADANETAQAWRAAIEGEGPTALVLTRQGVPTLDEAAHRPDGVQLGGYILRDADEADVVLVASGSEVALCMAAAELLRAEHATEARVVSLPCWEHFEAAGLEHRRATLGTDLPRLGVEAGSGFGWHRWVDDVVAIDGFGASGPAAEVMAHFGFTAEAVATRALALIATPETARS